ncbi:MAG: hypothetical protein QOI20_3435 [Acidimicrobiaceae bacterium]|nr:hypothetical protein [Acidimicrobiaceae bacterium]
MHLNPHHSNWIYDLQQVTTNVAESAARQDFGRSSVSTLAESARTYGVGQENHALYLKVVTVALDYEA